MRTVSQAVLDALTNERVIGGSIVVRDNRLTFTEVLHYESDTQVSDNAKSYDAATYSNGVLRVANVGDMLSYQWLPDPTAYPWPDWTATAVTLKAGSKPAVYSNRIFWQSAAGLFHYSDFTPGSGLGNVYTWCDVNRDVSAFAPVAADQVLVHWHEKNGSKNIGRVSHFQITGQFPPAWTETNWNGRIYGPNQYTRQFDAVKVGGLDYAFFTDQDEKRTLVLSRSGETWSDVRHVVPLDVVDENSQFKIGSATMLNNQLVVSGILRREKGPWMHIYSFGPDHYTLGRDLYIGFANAGDRYIYFNSVLHFSPALGGQLHLIGETVWYIGLNVCYFAPATRLVGVDNPDRKVALSGIGDVRMMSAPNSSFRLALDLPYTTAHPALRAGSEVDVSAALGGNAAKLGVFGIDSLVGNDEGHSRVKSILGRSLAVKKLAQWKADANFDYWSQAKQSGNPVTLEENIRACGKWSGEAYIVLDDLNRDGILYAVARPSRGAFARGRFYKENGSYKPRYGLILNYYRSTKQVAAELTGKDPDEITEADYGHNGLACLWGPEEYGGGPGIGVYLIRDNAWSQLASYSLSIPDNAWHWLQAEFQDGRIRVKYKAEAGTTWTWVNSVYFSHPTYEPWRRDEVGRSALYMHNGTTHANGYGCDSKSALVPVGDHSGFSTPETVLVDGEQIAIDGKSVARTKVENLVVAEGYTLQDAPTANPYGGPWEGYEIYIQTAGGPQDHDYYDGMALVVVDGPGQGACFKITDYDYSAPDQWVPSQQYTLPDTWMDHAGDPAHGSWQPAGMRRVFVEARPDGVIGPGSVVSIVPALSVSQRGANSTIATSHSAGLVSAYRSQKVRCDRFETFSVEMDMTLEDMATEIARKAGVMSVSAEKTLSGNFTRTHAGWSPDADVTATEVPDRPNFIAHFTITSGTEAGIAFRLAKSGSTYSGGKVITISGSNVKLYNYATTPVLVESVDAGFVLSGKITVSVQDNVFAVWANRRLVAVFVNNDGIVGYYAGFVANGNASFTVDWPALDLRVDNFILDMGKSGTQMLERLIGEKHIYFQDDQDGALRLYRSRGTVNPGDPFALAVVAGDQAADTDLVTRVRAEGGEIGEEMDDAAMALHGNLFALLNLTEAITYQESEIEARYYLDEALGRMNGLGLVGAADPRVEPNDVIEVALPEGVRTVVVDAVNLSLNVGEHEAVFDMDIEAHDAE